MTREMVLEFGSKENDPDVRVTVDNQKNIIKAQAWAPGLLKWVDVTKDIINSEKWSKDIDFKIALRK